MALLYVHQYMYEHAFWSKKLNNAKTPNIYSRCSENYYNNKNNHSKILISTSWTTVFLFLAWKQMYM